MVSDPEPHPRPRLWLRWLTVIGLLLALLVWLYFRDESLEPADDLLPQRPSAAGVPEEQNGWVQWQKVCESLPQVPGEELKQVQRLLFLDLPGSPGQENNFVLSEEVLMKLEAALNLPVWKNTEKHTIENVPRSDSSLAVLSWLDVRLITSIRQGNHADIMRVVDMMTRFGSRTIAGGTCLFDLLKGLSATSRLPWLLVQADFPEDELKKFADGLGESPCPPEDLAEILRQEHRMSRNAILDLIPSANSAVSRYFFKKNATANFAARIYRSQIDAVLTGRSSTETLLEEGAPDFTTWASRLSPNSTGRALAYSLVTPVGTLTLGRSAQHRCVRVLVALHRHWKATGVLPDDLSVLVPRYLPAVPADPYAPGQPLRWDKVKRVVYSVGPKKSAAPPDFNDKGKPGAAGWFKMVAPGGLGVRFRRPEEGPDVPVK